jgi:hypothetical protein
MAPRRGAGNAGIRGPASALTSFLAGLGVQPSTRLTTWGNSSHINADGTTPDEHLAPDGPVNDEAHLDPAGAVTARTVEAGPSAVGEGIPELETSKLEGEEQVSCSETQLTSATTRGQEKETSELHTVRRSRFRARRWT